MKRLFAATLSLLCLLPAAGQHRLGSNVDSTLTRPGEIPYEMKRDERKPTVSFDDCTRWFVETEHCDATLCRSNQEIVTDEYSGKIRYRTAQPQASIFVGLVEPLALADDWDCLDVWTLGDHWLWGEPHSSTSMPVYACFLGRDGEVHEINMVQSGYSQFAHKYWFLNHIKLNDATKLYSHFLGYRLRGNHTDAGTDHTVFLGNTYIYKEELRPLTFRPFPTDLPFPLRQQTILPTNKLSSYSNSVARVGADYRFDYKAKDARISYSIPAADLLGAIRVSLDGRQREQISPRIVGWADGTAARLTPTDVRLADDTLFFSAEGCYEGERVPFEGWYTINQKSLIFHLEETGEVGHVASLSSGTIERGDGFTTLIPFLKYNHSDRPSILCRDDLFTFMIFDWYKTNASVVSAGRAAEGLFTGGEMRYIPKTDGLRNPLCETLFVNVSPDVQEVLPTVDNPASPMRSLQADRLWCINGGADLDRLGAFVSDLRSKGLEKVTIRYHEDFWRKGGESYTFKLEPNPELGVEGVREYVQFVKDNDWRVGLYSNYTDMAPVNARWSPDMMQVESNGGWQVSWSRCYAPKPQVAWEMEAELAPQIQRIYGTNHSYCDVHTAISPLTRVDYDARVPDAGKMRGVYNRYGMLLMNERVAYNGPVYSEGGHHWWYAGLLDGNYANDDLTNLPLFPDFNLLKIHPLEMDAANTGTGHQYICYALAYGNLGILSEGNDAVMRYAFLQPMQQEYVMIPITSITYYQDGVGYDTSEALKHGMLKAPQLRLVYASGLEAYVNFGNSPWSIDVDGKTLTLPQYGFYAFSPQSGRCSASTLAHGERLDEVRSPELYYLNTHGRTVDAPLGGNGHYLLKKEKFAWELIPLDDSTTACIDVKLLDPTMKEAHVIGIDNQGDYLIKKYHSENGMIRIKPEKGVYKYQIVPAI